MLTPLTRPRTRAATAADVPLILELIRELAIYEKEPHAVLATEADLLRDGFGPEPRFRVLFAEDEGGAAMGFALYFYTYSTWLGGACLHLEDLFVRPEDRRRGAGIALMQALAREATDKGLKRLVWQVLDWNEPSIAFYEKLGAKVMRDWLPVRLEGEALAALADPGSLARISAVPPVPST
jgi:GNAT superfamily N-acetyltransferase